MRKTVNYLEIKQLQSGLYLVYVRNAYRMLKNP